jgi:aldose 1-epimerase
VSNVARTLLGVRFATLSLMIALFAVAAPAAKNYSAQKIMDQGIPLVRLADAASGVEVSILPTVGNQVIAMKVHGQNILYFPSTDLAEFQKKPSFSGIPFLAPWANRLDDQDFWANGNKYIFNMTLGNVRGPIPIHGLLSSSDLWEVTDISADGKSAQVTSRLEFWKHPELMAQWPFAHEYEMTYRLAHGALEVKVTVTNLSAEPMPIVLGFHPYYRIPGIPRDQWVVTLPARKTVIADDRLIATGEFKPLDLPNPLALKGHTLDTGFTDLERDSEGRAHFSIEAANKKIETIFGPKYPVTVIFAPPPLEGQPREFICIEPMAGITDAVNLQHEGKYPDLQTVAPGAKWTESFWILSSGI